MAIREILLLGNEILYKPSVPLEAKDREKALQVAKDLEDTLLDFRKKVGFGRAVAAPQIGESVRMIYMNLDGKVTVFVNPVIHFPDDETFELWDDCMSFPGLHVYVRRHKKCQVHYLDLAFQPHEIAFEGDLAELFQHEYDHLDGILATQRAIDSKSFKMVNPAKF